MSAPILFRWSGTAMEPLPRFARRCDEQFVVGMVYRLAEEEERSQISHDHQFAFVADAWSNLPEQYRNEPWAQSPTHLRRYALIKTGFCDTQTYVCGTKAEAERWARNLRPLDEYSIVSVEGTTVYRFTAMSQRKRAMGRKRFQESKTAIMDYLADLIGVPPEQLQAEAGKAA